MLTTKLGSLNGKGLAAFSRGPVLKSEGTILFSLTPSMLIPLKHNENSTRSVSFSWASWLSSQQDVRWQHRTREGRRCAQSPSGRPAGGESLEAAPTGQKPQQRQPGPQPPGFLAPECHAQVSHYYKMGAIIPSLHRRKLGLRYTGSRPHRDYLWIQSQVEAIPKAPPSPWHHMASTPAHLVKLCLETLRQKRSSPFKGLIGWRTQDGAGTRKGTRGCGHSEHGE